VFSKVFFIAELKQKEATIIRKMQQKPQEFDPTKLEIQIDCPEPKNIAAGLTYNIKNEQSIIQRPAQIISMPAASVQKEPNFVPLFLFFANNFKKLMFQFITLCLNHKK